MAKPYQEGKVWSIRFQVKKQDIYLTGFTSKTKALEAAEAKRQAILGKGKQSGLGPERTVLAQALQAYALAKLPYMKGAYKEANRINRYLRAAGLDTLRVSSSEPNLVDTTKKPLIYSIELVPAEPSRPIPNSLKQHRQTQSLRTATSDRLRAQLALTKVAEVTRNQVQNLISAMMEEKSRDTRQGNAEHEEAKHYKPATLHNERAMLRAFFNFANRIWSWTVPGGNPASGLVMPSVDNERTRVLTNAEWRRLTAALEEYGNPYVTPALVLLLETTMRSSEPLVRATWGGMDWERSVLALPTAKAGKRDVPLSPIALNVMQQLYERRNPNSQDMRILPLTYEALKKGWTVACEKAGVADAKIHDLRHTGTTRFALVYNGNLPVLKRITGHKTDSQLMRYINITADDVVRLMHGRSLDEGSAPAGMTAAEVAKIFQPSPSHPASPSRKSAPQADLRSGDNIVQIDFRRRRSA